MLKAFCGVPIVVERRSRPSGSSRAVSGHVCGDPVRYGVMNSGVK
jgi:hypothetical protein